MQPFILTQFVVISHKYYHPCWIISAVDKSVLLLLTVDEKQKHINPLWSSNAAKRHRPGDIDLVNIGSANGLFPDGTKSLPKSMLTFHWQSSVAIAWGQFHSECRSHFFL